MKGCSFHWSQQVYRKVTRLGLAPAYTQKEGVYHYIWKLLALPYLPAERVTLAFTTLREQAVESESARILDLVEYIIGLGPIATSADNYSEDDFVLGVFTQLYLLCLYF